MEPVKNSRPALSILIVEDDRAAGEIIGIIIAKEFSDVIINIAENGKQGVELFKEHMPDIVITDISMPVMGGIQMACEIKSVKDDTQLIVFTGYTEEKCLEKFRDIGVNHYMAKPFKLDKLFAAIEKCVAEK